MNPRLLLSSILPLFATTALADLTNQNTPLCTTPGGQDQPIAISDGSGGAIVAWPDFRNGNTNVDIFAQRISSAGVVLWATNGIPICTASGNQQFISMVADGSGGAFISWTDERGPNEDIYAQRVNSSGIAQWGTNGMKVGGGNGNQEGSPIVLDGAGGVILGWTDIPPNHDANIVAQRLDGAGHRLWGSQGVTVCNAPGDQFLSRIVADGSGGAIAAWLDSRFGTNGAETFGQRIGSNGQMLWASNGLQLSSTGNLVEGALQTVADGNGGGLFMWVYGVTGGDSDLGARHVTAAGVSQTPFVLCDAPQEQELVDAIPDGTGGSFIVWGDDRDDPDGGNPNQDVFAQHLSASDAPLWAVNGIPITQAAGFQKPGRIALDGSGGVWFTWYSHPFNGQGSDGVYAQHLNAAGAPASPPDTISILFGESPVPVPNGSGGIVTAWRDGRAVNPGIYAQIIPPPGMAAAATTLRTVESPPADSRFGIRSISPNPVRGRSGGVDFELPRGMQACLTLRDVQGRTVRVLQNGFMGAGLHHVVFDLSDRLGSPLPRGIYLLELGAVELRAQGRLAVIR